MSGTLIHGQFAKFGVAALKPRGKGAKIKWAIDDRLTPFPLFNLCNAGKISYEFPLCDRRVTENLSVYVERERWQNFIVHEVELQIPAEDRRRRLVIGVANTRDLALQFVADHHSTLWASCTRWVIKQLRPNNGVLEVQRLAQALQHLTFPYYFSALYERLRREGAYRAYYRAYQASSHVAQGCLVAVAETRVKETFRLAPRVESWRYDRFLRTLRRRVEIDAMKTGRSGFL